MILQNPSAPQLLPAKPSRWFSLEFCLYWLILAYSLKLVIGSAVGLSQVDHPNYARFKHKLSAGWILGRKIDNSDSQYRRFRLGLAQLVLLAIGYLGLSKLSKTLLLRRAHFQSISSALILTALHGTSVIKILLIVGSNYLISRRLLVKSTRISSSLIWLFNLIILFANDYWDGYRFRHLSASLAFLDAGPYRGLIPRWQIGFNISMLRLISYAFDYRWAAQNSFQNQTVSEFSEPEFDKERVKFHRIESDYCFQNYFNYIFYPPLYIAGPIITFNNFISQMNQKPASVTSKAILGFFARFLTCFLTLEWILHYMYVVAIKDAKAWQGDTPFELGIIGYWNLIIIWLKLLIPWRFFRLWSLLDGVDPPENMVRCMSNNYSTLEFWRSWHRSYNLWIVRYLYIPLGGSNNMILSTIIVFTFVALWHDLSFKLLTWGWLVSFFVLPEVIAKKVFANSAYQHEPWFRHLVALGGTFNVMAMMSANLVGFSIGVDGVKFMWKEMLGSWAGLQVFVTILLVVFCAVQVMIEYRSAEKREGIHRKC